VLLSACFFLSCPVPFSSGPGVWRGVDRTRLCGPSRPVSVGSVHASSVGSLGSRLSYRSPYLIKAFLLRPAFLTLVQVSHVASTVYHLVLQWHLPYTLHIFALWSGRVSSFRRVRWACCGHSIVVCVRAGSAVRAYVRRRTRGTAEGSSLQYGASCGTLSDAPRAACRDTSRITSSPVVRLRVDLCGDASVQNTRSGA
jgi:hypothetical protein